MTKKKDERLVILVPSGMVDDLICNAGTPLECVAASITGDQPLLRGEEHKGTGYNLMLVKGKNAPYICQFHLLLNLVSMFKQLYFYCAEQMENEKIDCDTDEPGGWWDK